MGKNGSIILNLYNKEERQCTKKLEPEKRCVVGRDKEISDIVLSDGKISRKHCEIRYDVKRNCLWVKDCSANGCSVSGKKRLIRDVFVKVPLQEKITFDNTDYSIGIEQQRKFPMLAVVGILLCLAAGAILLGKFWHDQKEDRLETEETETETESGLILESITEDRTETQTEHDIGLSTAVDGLSEIMTEGILENASESLVETETETELETETVSESEPEETTGERGR